MESILSDSSSSAKMVMNHYNFVGATSIEHEILMELEKRAEYIQVKNKGIIDPTFFLTLDKLTGLKYHKPVSPQILQTALDRILDVKQNGAERKAYLYPYLIKERNKVIVKIALLYPYFAGENTKDVTPYIEASFNYSIPILDDIAESKSKNPIGVQHVKEENPGDILLVSKEAKKIFFYDRLSFEQQLKSLISAGYKFDKHFQIKPHNNSDFIAHVISYLKSNDKIIEILPDYHIVKDKLHINKDGSYARPPEVIQHYRAQADALEKYALPIMNKVAVLKNWTQSLSQIEEFISKGKELEKGRKQSKERIAELSSLLQNFPFDDTDISIEKKEIIYKSLDVLSALIQKKDELIHRKNRAVFDEIINQTSQQILANTINLKTLSVMNLDKLLDDSDIKDETLIKEYKVEIRKILKEKFGYYDDENDKTYFVDIGYLMQVQDHLAEISVHAPENKKLFDISKKIEKKYHNRKYLNSKLNTEQKKTYASLIVSNQKNYQNKISNQSNSDKYNISRGVLVSFLLAIVYSILLIIDFSFFPLIFLFILLAFLSFLKRSKVAKEQKEQLKSLKNKSTSDEPINSDYDVSNEQNEKEEKKKMLNQNILETVESLLVPRRFKNPADKIFTESDLINYKKSIVNSVPELKKIHKDNSKFLTALDFSLRGKYLRIAVKNDLVKKGFPTGFFVSRSDFFNDRIRTDISEYFRDKLKNTQDKNKQAYFKYIINVLEMEYYKYKNKIKR